MSGSGSFAAAEQSIARRSISAGGFAFLDIHLTIVGKRPLRASLTSMRAAEIPSRVCYRNRAGWGQAIVSTTPPSTRSAAPVVADACVEAI